LDYDASGSILLDYVTNAVSAVAEGNDSGAISELDLCSHRLECRFQWRGFRLSALCFARSRKGPRKN
jgi:hypothetical protein